MFNYRKLLNPIFIFITIWLLMLTTYFLQISYFMPFEPFLLFAIFSISALSFLVGYSFSYVISKTSLFCTNGKIRKRHKVDEKIFIYMHTLRLIYVMLFIVIFLIIIYNYIIFGYPPIMNFFANGTAINYLDYGKFKGILFPTLSILFLISSFDRSQLASIFVKLTTILLLLIYVSRGFIISTLIQYFFLKLFLAKRVSKIRFFTYILSVSVIILTVMYIVGSFRTGNEIFKRAMEIKEEFYNYPTSLLWVIGYISFPLANIVSFIKNFKDFYCGLITLDNSLPAFINVLPPNFSSLYESLLPNQFNTVATYMGCIYLDFGFWGIIFMNIVLGSLSYFFYKKANTNILPSSIFYSALTLIFFGNFIFFFPFVFEIVLATFIQKLIIKRKGIVWK